jgi:hypothetical protein
MVSQSQLRRLQNLQLVIDNLTSMYTSYSSFWDEGGAHDPTASVTKAQRQTSTHQLHG